MVTDEISLLSYNPSTTSIINRIPIEVLSYVFHEIEDPVKVSHVCRAWRELALTEINLWTKIRFVGDHQTNPRMVKHYLDCSRSAPLTVGVLTCPMHFDADEEEDEDKDEDFKGEDNKCYCFSILKLILTHLPRIKELKVACEPMMDDSDVQNILEEAFSTFDIPILENLELSAYSDPWLPLGPTCYPYRAPALRKLRLNNTLIDWNSAIFQNLTELCINLSHPDGIVGGQEYWVHIDQLLDILESSPNLKLIFLCSCLLWDLTPDDTENFRCIRLPFLTEITLRHMPFTAYLAIVQSVEVPQHANWYIQDLFPPEDQLAPLCDVIKTLSLKVETLQPRDLTLTLAENSVSLFSSRFVGTDTKLDVDRDSVIDISVHLQERACLLDGDPSISRIPLFRDVAQLISALNTANNVIRLSVRFKRLGSWARFRRKKEKTRIEKVLYESSIWTGPLLHALLGIEHLVLRLYFGNEENSHATDNELYYYKRGFLEGIISNLVANAPTLPEGTSSSKEFLCPKLRTVEIAHGHGILSGNLIRFLKSRCEQGAPIHILTLTWSENVPKMVSDALTDKTQKLVERVYIEVQGEQKGWAGRFRPKHDEFKGFNWFYKSKAMVRSLFEYDSDDDSNEG